MLENVHDGHIGGEGVVVDVDVVDAGGGGWGGRRRCITSPKITIAGTTLLKVDAVVVVAVLLFFPFCCSSLVDTVVDAVDGVIFLCTFDSLWRNGFTSL